MTGLGSFTNSPLVRIVWQLWGIKINSAVRAERLLSARSGDLRWGVGQRAACADSGLSALTPEGGSIVSGDAAPRYEIEMSATPGPSRNAGLERAISCSSPFVTMNLTGLSFALSI
jgi:hypothetical protein